MTNPRGRRQGAAERRLIAAAMAWFVAQRQWHNDYSDGSYQTVVRTISQLRDACESVAVTKKGESNE